MRQKNGFISGGALGKLLLLLGFAWFYGNIVWTGTVKQYVHPRMIPYMIFTSIVMVVMAFFMAGELFRKSRMHEGMKPLIFFFLPLITAIIFPAVPMEAGMNRNAGINLSSSSIGSDGRNQNAEKKAQTQKEISEDTNLEPQETPWIRDGRIVLENPDYYQCLNDIYSNMDNYQGMTVEMVGFVFRDNELFLENQFVPARLLMVCCAADMAPIGLLCEYDQAAQLEESAWIKVTGTLSIKEYDGETVPIVQVTKVESAKVPEQEYIYPY